MSFIPANFIYQSHRYQVHSYHILLHFLAFFNPFFSPSLWTFLPNSPSKWSLYIYYHRFISCFLVSLSPLSSFLSPYMRYTTRTFPLSLTVQICLARSETCSGSQQCKSINCRPFPRSSNNPSTWNGSESENERSLRRISGWSQSSWRIGWSWDRFYLLMVF